MDSLRPLLEELSATGDPRRRQMQREIAVPGSNPALAS